MTDEITQVSVDEQIVIDSLSAMEKCLKSMRKAVERFDLLTATKREREFWDICFEISPKSPDHLDYEKHDVYTKIIEADEKYLNRFRDLKVGMNELRVRLESHNWIVQKLVSKHIL